jgi:hypothetical protein
MYPLPPRIASLLLSHNRVSEPDDVVNIDLSAARRRRDAEAEVVWEVRRARAAQQAETATTSTSSSSSSLVPLSEMVGAMLGVVAAPASPPSPPPSSAAARIRALRRARRAASPADEGGAADARAAINGTDLNINNNRAGPIVVRGGRDTSTGAGTSRVGLFNMLQMMVALGGGGVEAEIDGRRVERASRPSAINEVSDPDAPADPDAADVDDDDGGASGSGGGGGGVAAGASGFFMDLLSAVFRSAANGEDSSTEDALMNLAIERSIRMEEERQPVSSFMRASYLLCV